MDNFVHSLFWDLAKENIKATGTAHEERTGGANRSIMDKKDLKKQPRGSFDQRCDRKVSVVSWNDTK